MLKGFTIKCHEMREVNLTILNFFSFNRIKLVSVIFLFLAITIRMNLVAQNSPVTTLGTSSTFKTNVIVPVTVDGFNDISSCALKIIYDPAVATPVGITTGPRLGGTANFNLTVSGEIRIGWYASRVVSLNSGDTIFNITFNKVSNGKIGRAHV